MAAVRKLFTSDIIKSLKSLSGWEEYLDVHFAMATNGA